MATFASISKSWASFKRRIQSERRPRRHSRILVYILIINIKIHSYSSSIPVYTLTFLTESGDNRTTRRRTSASSTTLGYFIQF